MSGHTSEEILDSLTWHSIVLGLDLTASQWQEHKRRLACRACEHGTPLAQVPEAFVKQGGGT